MKHQTQIILLVVIVCSACARLTPPAAEPNDALAYQNQLHGMWLGSTIANWTGLQTEGVRTEPPFYTDDDWGQIRPVRWSDEELPVDFVFQDPWLADDDTDIEYVYLHLMAQHRSPLLTAEQISDGWQTHINHHIWVSNASARLLIDADAHQPVTSMLTVNENSLAIDAQLTTEIFGAVAPGMPGQALQLADLPIRTTASGYAAHAAQFYVVLYSLASQVDPAHEPKDQVLWLVEEARSYIPDSSKTADIADFVLADYLSNPDVDNWERTRDRVYDRYQLNAEPNGFVYRDWTESSVNFAAGLIALLYGEGNFKRTVQIGTLSGWDSDNGTSSMAGVIGLMVGYDALVAQFPEQEFSDRYHILRTRDDMPDYLPNDQAAEDTFLAMSARMLPLVEQSIVLAGGSAENGEWRLPPVAEPRLMQNPAFMLTRRSHNNANAQSGGMVTATANGLPAAGLADGLEHNFSGREVFDIPEPLMIQPNGDPIELTVIYDRPVEIHSVVLIEGGRGFDSVEIELLVGGDWFPAELDANGSDPPSRQAYERLTFELAQPTSAAGFRLIGQADENGEELVFIELDALAPAEANR